MRMNPSSAKKRKREHLLCPHCDSYLNEKSFRDHKRLYFSPATKKWIRREECRESDSEDDLPSLPDSRSSDSGDLLHQTSPQEVDSSPLSLPDQPVESLHPDHSSVVEDIELEHEQGIILSVFLFSSLCSHCPDL